MTWKEFKYVVENQIDNNGIDLERQPIDIHIKGDILINLNRHDISCRFYTRDMPRRCTVEIANRKLTK